MKKFLTLLLFLIFSVQCAFAIQETKKVDLKTAIEIAQKNNLDIKSERLEIHKAKNDIKISNRLQNPDFNLFYNIGPSGHGNPQQIGMTELIELGKRGARKKLAKANYQLTKENLDYLEFDLKMDVREAYINLVAAKSVLKSLQDEYDWLTELLEITEEKMKTNSELELDLIQAQMAHNQMETQLNTAKMNKKVALIEFNKVINSQNEFFDSADEIFQETNNYEEMMTLHPEKDFPDFSLIAGNSLNNRYDIKIARAEIEIAKKNLITVSRQRIPDLAVTGGYGYQNRSLSDDGTFKNGAYVAANIVNLPLFYNYSPEIKNAKIALDKALIKYESVENKALKDLEKAYETFVTSKINLNYYNNKLVKESKALINASKQGYKEGKTDLTSLIVMEQAYQSIIAGYTYALSDYYNAWVGFLRELNREEFNFDSENI